MGQERNRFLKNYVRLSETEQRELFDLFPPAYQEYARKEIAQYESIQAELARFVEQFVAEFAAELGDEFPQYAVEHAPKTLLRAIMSHWKNRPFMVFLQKAAVDVFYERADVPMFAGEKDGGE